MLLQLGLGSSEIVGPSLPLGEPLCAGAHVDGDAGQDVLFGSFVVLQIEGFLYTGAKVSINQMFWDNE